MCPSSIKKSRYSVILMLSVSFCTSGRCNRNPCGASSGQKPNPMLTRFRLTKVIYNDNFLSTKSLAAFFASTSVLCLLTGTNELYSPQNTSQDSGDIPLCSIDGPSPSIGLDRYHPASFLYHLSGCMDCIRVMKYPFSMPCLDSKAADKYQYLE